MSINTHYYHANHHFCVQMFELQHFRRSGEVKALCARRSWVIMMCSVGETFYSPSISPRSWNNWLSILEYSRVSCDLFSQSKLEAFWPIAFERCREKFSCIVQKNSYFYFFRLNRTLRHSCLFINGFDVT